MRCFVALLPDPAARERLDQLAQAWLEKFPRSRRIPAENLHLTLAFIGPLDNALALPLAEAIAALPRTAAELELNEVGTFARARVLWAGGTTTDALETLARNARALLTQQGIAFDRKPFVPHVTLLRQAAAPVSAVIDPPLRWRVGGPVLMRSDPGENGPRYRAVLAP